MLPLLLKVIAPLLSLIIFILGSGFLTTLLTVRIHHLGGSSWFVGIMTGIYYLGVVIGSFLIGRIIRRVGHIRLYATCAALMAAAIMLQGMFTNDPAWLVLRFITGVCTAGLYVAIESWLLVISPEDRRGQVLSLYMVSFYGAMAAGQFLLNLSNPDTILPFCIITILCSLSIVPLAMTRAACPTFEDINGLSLLRLFKISPSGFTGCFSAGLITGAVYGVMPFFVKDLHYSTSFVAWMMGLIICGAMLIQFPVGKLSDLIERRKVLIGSSFISFLICIVVILFASHSQKFLLILAFAFGGVAYTIYPLSISLTCDYLESTDIVAATQGLLLINGIGSIIGPAIAPAFMGLFGHFGLFVYFAFITLSLSIFFAWRRTKRASIPTAEQQEFVAVPRTTPVVTELDPRAEE